MAEKKQKKAGLGKGLGALFSTPADTLVEDISLSHNGDSVKLLPLSDIEPDKNQPRKSFDEDKLSALSRSIKEHGVLSPIIVSPTKNGTYKIIAGERRWRASKLAELRHIPCIIKDFDKEKAAEVTLVENLQRDDLNPIEEAEGYLRLMESFSLTQEEVSNKVGKSRSAVANALRLNNLCPEVKAFLKDESLSQGHARALLPLNAERQLALAEKVIENGLSVRQTEALVKADEKAKPASSKSKKSSLTQKYFSEIESGLSSRFGTKVKIREGAKKGKIEIEYYSKDDLERILFELKK